MVQRTMILLEERIGKEFVNFPETYVIIVIVSPILKAEVAYVHHATLAVSSYAS